MYVQGIVALLLVTADFPADAHDSLALPATTACLDTAVANGRATHSFSGMAAVVVLDGRTVYHRGLGTVSPTSAQAVQPSTRFRVGSITKMMTATAVLSLAEEGRIHLHSPVAQLLPAFELNGEPGWMDRLTAHRLLSHQGGIADSGNTVGPTDDGALAAAFYDPTFTSTVPLLVAPGTFYNYSNTNFMLAGLLAETAAGTPYRVLMRQRVFKPLGMKRAAFLASEVAADNDVAFGVGEGGAPVYAPGAYDDAVERPAGYVWASVDDLAKFITFILRGNRAVLSGRMWRAMQTRQVNTYQVLDRQGYGYGLVIEEAAGFPDTSGQLRFYDGARVVWHDGAIPGYTALLVTLPRQQFGYAALVNGDVSNVFVNLAPCMRTAAVETIGRRLPPPSDFPPPDIQRDRFVDYVGEYADRVGILPGRAIVTLAPDGNLHIQFPALDNAPLPYDPVLSPVNRDNFALNIAGTSIRVTGFREGGSGIVHLRTRVTVLTRMPVPEAAQRLAAPVVDVVALKRAVREASRERDTLLPQ
jgi:CubicO group peptidase (beta-lactamase class C family)